MCLRGVELIVERTCEMLSGRHMFIFGINSVFSGSGLAAASA